MSAFRRTLLVLSVRQSLSPDKRVQKIFRPDVVILPDQNVQSLVDFRERTAVPEYVLVNTAFDQTGVDIDQMPAQDIMRHRIADHHRLSRVNILLL